MNIHVARSAEQLAMTSDYINGALAMGNRPDLIFSKGQVCGLSRCVEYRDSWSLAFSEIAGDKKGLESGLLFAVYTRSCRSLAIVNV